MVSIAIINKRRDVLNNELRYYCTKRNARKKIDLHFSPASKQQSVSLYAQ
jgi:hypothetical protein